MMIDELKISKTYGPIKIIASKYGANYNTLRNKYNKFKNGKLLNSDNEEHRVGLNKSFKKQDEYELFLYLKEKYIDQNKILCDEIIKIIAQKKFTELYQNNKFHASNGWCLNFKKKMEFVNR